MFKLHLSPTFKKKIRAFLSIKRGFYSFLALLILIIISLFAELIANNRAIIVKYEGKYYFPTYGNNIPGSTFGLDYKTETRYKELKKQWQKDKDNPNFIIMPLIPYGKYEIDTYDYFDKNNNKIFAPYPPNIESRHFFGTDTIGRDILTRLIYAFRIAIFFSLLLVFFSMIIGFSIGCITGYIGGKFDILFMRVLEIYSSLSSVSLFFIMIISSIIIPSIITLFILLSLFNWMVYVYDARSLTFKEKARDYVVSARALGASNARIIFKYIIPNISVLLIIALPFSISSGINAITTLDFLGFGVPEPTPSIGHMIESGRSQLNKPWILLPPVALLTSVLIMVTFIGEALRESFDPRKFSYFE